MFNETVQGWTTPQRMEPTITFEMVMQAVIANPVGAQVLLVLWEQQVLRPAATEAAQLLRYASLDPTIVPHLSALIDTHGKE